MTSKLKCPFCQKGLSQGYNHDRDTVIYHCNNCYFQGDGIIWIALIQAKQDLEIARKALEEYADEDMWENCCKWDIEYIQGLFLEHGYEIAKEALEQIEQKEERNESIRSNIDD